jgi:uncharacterized OB-fold protein
MAIARRRPPELFKLAVNHWTQPFWQATKEHRLLLARCADCGHARMPPTPFCPQCQSQRIAWTVLSGLGTVYSYTVVTRAILPDMDAHLPYVPAVIALDGADGVRLISNVVDIEVQAITVGLRVQVVWDDAPSQGVAVPRFAPVATAAA